MRTTLTLDEDVAVMVKRLRKARGDSFKGIVNAALREGLKQMAAPARRRAAFHTQAADLGRCLVGGVDNVADALALADGESFR
jgi:hypothetical protein